MNKQQAIQGNAVIASEAKQSRMRAKELDCASLLAMTREKHYD